MPSPGRLFLAYTSTTTPHTFSVNYIDSVDITDTVACRNDADELSNALADSVTPSVRIQAWGIKSPDGTELFFEPFAAEKVGTATPPSGASQWKSSTVRFLGKGTGITVGSPRGRTSLEIFIADSVHITPGMKYVDIGAVSTAWGVFLDLLNTNLRYFADSLGNHADAGTNPAVQFHSHAQKTLGS